MIERTNHDRAERLAKIFGWRHEGCFTWVPWISGQSNNDELFHFAIVRRIASAFEPGVITRTVEPCMVAAHSMHLTP